MGSKHSKVNVDNKRTSDETFTVRGGGTYQSEASGNSRSLCSDSSSSTCDQGQETETCYEPCPPVESCESAPFTTQSEFYETGGPSQSEPSLRTTGDGYNGRSTTTATPQRQNPNTPSVHVIKHPPSAYPAESSASLHQHPAIKQQTATTNQNSTKKSNTQQQQHRPGVQRAAAASKTGRNAPVASQSHRSQSQNRQRDPYNARLRSFAPPVYISSGSSGNRNSSGGGGSSGMGPIDRLSNVDVVEELCYMVPGECKPQQAYDYYSINECGELEFVAEGPVCPSEPTTNPVTYTKRQRFNFKQNQPGGDEDGPPFAWPYDLNPCKCNCCRGGRGRDTKCGCECCTKGQARRAYYYDELPVGKNPDVKPERPDTSSPHSHSHNKHSHCVEEKELATDLIKKGKCDGVVPSDSGIYYFDAEKRQFFPHQQEVIVEAPPPPPPQPAPIEYVEEIPPPVIQPLIIPPFCGCNCNCGFGNSNRGMNMGCCNQNHNGSNQSMNMGMNGNGGMGMNMNCCPGMGMNGGNNCCPCPCPMACPMPVMMMPGCPQPQQQQMPYPFPFPKKKKKHKKKKRVSSSSSDSEVEIVTHDTTIIDVEDSEPTITEAGDTPIIQTAAEAQAAADVRVEVDNNYTGDLDGENQAAAGVDGNYYPNEDQTVAHLVR